LAVPACVAGHLFTGQGLTLFRRERAFAFVWLSSAMVFFGLLLSLHGTTRANFGWALLGADLWVALAAGLHLRNTVRKERNP